MSCIMQGDSRAPASHLAWEVSADVEDLAWDPSNPTRFLVSSEDGIVAAFDARSGGGASPLYRLSAHDKPACCLSFNPAAKGLLATASTDKQVRHCTQNSGVAQFVEHVCLARCSLGHYAVLHCCGGVSPDLLNRRIILLSSVGCAP